MRKHIKSQLTDILDSLLMLHKELLGKETFEIIDSLQDCQNAAVVVGEALEKESEIIKNQGFKEGSQKEINIVLAEQAVSLLEQYCEELFLISQEEVVSWERVGSLNLIIEQTAAIVGSVCLTYQVVFFPYKAEMWDSLESIWYTCMEDELCEAVVVPIPYFRYDAKKEETVICYDGEKFPEYVPVISYLEYSLQNETPEVAYIHNPYDNGNLVTSVHPSYYSSELKKYVGKLVYVPYYVTTGGISPNHLLFPAYVYMDYMVVQSHLFKDGCKGMFYYDRVLPLGSPKLDKVIHLCKQEKKDLVPNEWKSCLEGKKSLMLNTSLNCILQQGELYLHKISVLFQGIKRQKEIVIVWRPHPLLEATMDSLRPELLEKYKALKDYFENEKLGVFDSTSDIEKTVAIVDGYIGEESTSVVNLFGAVGKPLFILNNYIYKEAKDNWKQKIRISDMVFADNKWYMVSSLCNGLFSVKGDDREAAKVRWEQIEFEGRVEKQPKWYGAHLFLMNREKEVYLSPELSFEVGCYRCKEGKLSVLESPSKLVQEKKFMHCGEMLSYGDKVIFLPRKNDTVWEYSVLNKRWIEHKECMDALRKGIPSESYSRMPDISGYVQMDSEIYITASYTNRVLCLDLKDLTHKVYEVGDVGYTYSAITGSEGILWLAESASGKIVKWDKSREQVSEWDMPLELECFIRFDGVRLVHNKIFEMGQWIITIPAFSGCMVKVNKMTGEICLCAKDLWSKAGQTCNDYHPQYHVSCNFAKKINEKILWIQRVFDDALIELKVDTEEYSIHYPMMTKQALDKLLEKEDGFERPNRDYYAFARRESRLFSMEDFMEDLILGRLETVRERQLSELSDFANNLDGSCGKKVHEYIMNVLKKEERGI